MATVYVHRDFVTCVVHLTAQCALRRAPVRRFERIDVDGVRDEFDAAVLTAQVRVGVLCDDCFSPGDVRGRDDDEGCARG